MKKTRESLRSLAVPASMTLLIDEDNGGSYHWTILAAGETLVRSGSFASYDEAKQAAGIVRDGVSSASFEDVSTRTAPTAISARRDRATVRDRLDAERWLDEDGGFSRQAEAKWR